MRRIYLAGPDVFLADALNIGRRKQQMCEEFGFRGLFPLDNNPQSSDDPAKIFNANCTLMRSADIGLLNLTPFRGVSADPGTVFELGYMFALGLPVFGYANIGSSYADRVAVTMGPLVAHDLQLRDERGFAVENFGLIDNLMIVRAIEESGGALVTVVEEKNSNPCESLAAFQAFRTSLKAICEQLGKSMHK